MANPYNAKLKFCFLGSDYTGALPLATPRGNNSLDLFLKVLFSFISLNSPKKPLYIFYPKNPRVKQIKSKKDRRRCDSPYFLFFRFFVELLRFRLRSFHALVRAVAVGIFFLVIILVPDHFFARTLEVVKHNPQHVYF